MDRKETNGGHLDQPIGEGSAESLQEPDEYISLTVVTMGDVRELDHVSLGATVGEVIERVRREAAIDWSDILVTVRSGGPELRAVSPKQTLLEAGIAEGDTLIFTPSATWGSGWQEVAIYLGTSASAGVIGGAAYDLLKSTIKTLAARWQGHRGSDPAPSLSQDEALRIAHACLSLTTRIEDRGDLRVVSIRSEAARGSGSETWVVTFILPDRSVEVKVLVPEEGPEHTMVLLDHRPGGYL